MALMLARQPILDYRNNTYGYELLYRDGAESVYKCDNGDIATSNVMAAGFLSMGFNQMTGNKKAFINFTKNMLLHGVATLFPKDQIVIEILEDIEPTTEVINACRNLKAKGYALALDDFVFRPGYEALIDIADVIKVDFMLTKSDADRRNIIKQFKNGKIRFLAEKIENHDDFRAAVKAGYTLFQGYYFSKPVVEHSKGISPATMNHIHLINSLEKKDPKFTDISKIIEKDVAFSYEILRIANTAYYYRGSKITSIRQAAVRIGLDELKKWAFITVLRKIGGGSNEAIVNLSVQRAKALELICERVGLNDRKMEFFTLGILSMIDVLTGCSMEVLLPELPVSDESKRILLGDYDDGQMSACFKLVLAYEKGKWPRIFEYSEKYAINVEAITEAYFQAVVWVNNFEA